MEVVRCLIVAALLFVLYKVVPILFSPYTSPLRYIPGPPSPNWLYGHLRAIFKAETSVLHEQWANEYGLTFRYKGLFNRDRLCTVDTRALNHILTHSLDFEKPEQARYELARMLGKGVLFVEGEQHHKQRRVMNPAFGPAQIRELTPVFFQKAIELRDLWSAEIAEQTSDKDTHIQGKIDVLSGLSRATLDMIGLAGFNYAFDSLSRSGGQPNELRRAFETAFQDTMRIPVWSLVQAMVPFLRIIQTKQQRLAFHAQQKMRAIGMKLLAERKASLARSRDASLSLGEDKSGDRLEGRDLLTLLVKANMGSDVLENQRLSDEDVIAQVPTFLVAGHETTSTAVTWALYALTQAPAAQRRLRAELRSVPEDSPGMDALNALPYLDCVVREALRVHAPVPNSIRVAAKDTSIPLERPFVDTLGNTHDRITIKKGQPVFIPILLINRSRELWGPDAADFRPERWERPPEAAAGIPGVWGHMLTFLGGPHACIGYRFSIVEMKALLFTLVRAFEFELAVPQADIGRRSAVVQKPLVLSEKEKGSQMPLVLKPVLAV